MFARIVKRKNIPVVNNPDTVPLPGASSDDSQQRLINMNKLKEAGRRPFGVSFTTTGSLSEIRNNFQEGASVSAAGRMLAIRDMGKSLFADLRSGGERFQIFAGKSQSGDFESDYPGEILNEQSIDKLKRYHNGINSNCQRGNKQQPLEEVTNKLVHNAQLRCKSRQ